MADSLATVDFGVVRAIFDGYVPITVMPKPKIKELCIYGEPNKKSRLTSCYHLHDLFDEKTKTKVINKAYKVLKQHQDEFDAIAVSGMSMALIAPVLAWRLKKNIVLVRKPGEKSHSRFGVEGYMHQRVVMVDDFISSGETYNRVLCGMERLQSKLVGVYFYKEYWKPDSDLLKGVPCWNEKEGKQC